MKKCLIFPICVLITFISCVKENVINKPPNDYYNQQVGASANDLLSNSKYTKLKLEIQYMPGYSLDANTITNLQNLLKVRLNKSDGIEIITTQIGSSGKAIYSIDDISAIETNKRTSFDTSHTIALYILIVDGDYSTSGVLGVAYKNTSMVLIGKTIHNNSGGLGQASRVKLESAVINHEIGHVLGLVNVGSSLQSAHEDKSHVGHCDNKDCLMYYASETTDFLGFLLTGSIPDFDANCKADLKANGGK